MSEGLLVLSASFGRKHDAALTTALGGCVGAAAAVRKILVLPAVLPVTELGFSSQRTVGEIRRRGT